MEKDETIPNLVFASTKFGMVSLARFLERLSIVQAKNPRQDLSQKGGIMSSKVVV